MRVPKMLIFHIVLGFLAGLIAAIATLATGGGFLLALGAYSLGGTLGMLAGAALMLIPARVNATRIATT